MGRLSTSSSPGDRHRPSKEKTVREGAGRMREGVAEEALARSARRCSGSSLPGFGDLLAQVKAGCVPAHCAEASPSLSHAFAAPVL